MTVMPTPTMPTSAHARSPQLRGGRLALAALLALLFAACASAPPPTQAMQHWQTERATPLAAEVSETEPDIVARADAAFERAQRAHDEGDTTARSHHLRLAHIHWTTALTRHQQAREAAVLAEARARVAQREGELAAIEADSDAMRAAIVAERGAAVASGARPMPTTERAKAEYTLDTAVVDLGRADEVAAETRAPLLFTKASLAYDEAAKHYGAGRYAAATEHATASSRLARDAYEKALPGHEQDALEARLEARRDELLTRLLRVGTPIVSEDDISISLVNYFPADEETIRPTRRGELDALADIAEAFPEYRIKVVGHTDDEGHPTDNLMLSQARALAVRKALEDNGVDRDRLTSVGQGESQAVELDRGDVINARVDVIFVPREMRVVRESVGTARAWR